MNWKQNKFLIGLGVVMVAGIGTLGFLLFQSFSRYSDLRSDYEQQAETLGQLQGQPLYPEQKNLVKLKEQRESAVQAALAFQKQVEPLSLPLAPITPEQFQDKLRATVSSIVENATKAGVKLPQKFYLGFEQYQSQPPKTEAASVLDRQMRAIELAMNTLIENRVAAIIEVYRPQLAEEGNEGNGPQEPAATGKVARGKQAQKSDLVSKYRFDITFTSDQGRFRKSLNDLSKNDKQFFIVRPVIIENDHPHPITKAAANTAAGMVLPVTGSAPASGAAQPKAQNLKWLVGPEKLNVQLRLEMVVFASASSK